MIHDGPGPLSPLLLDGRDLQTVSSRRVQTSAYGTFIRIQLHDLNINASLALHITTDDNMRKGLLCSNQYAGSSAANSNRWKNIFCMDIIFINYEYMIINVEAFIFSGPNMLTYTSDSICQYGGLLVDFYQNTDYYEFCESLHDYTVHTRSNSLTFILVWFSGYSLGNFTAFLSAIDCRPYYLE